MKLEEQVCSLELAKKLKELGVRQESLWFWCLRDYDAFAERHKPKNFTWDLNDGICGGEKEFCSAFTVAELGEMLPSGVSNKVTVLSLEMWTFGDPKQHCVQYRRITDDYKEFIPFDCFSDENEANARAKMLVYLIENKIINA